MKYFQSETAEEIRHYLEKRQPQYLDLLREMVNVNSFTRNPEGVNRLGDYTQQNFSALSFQTDKSCLMM